MMTMTTRIQLIAFALAAVLSISYGAVKLFNVGTVMSPPYVVKAEFANAGGIYPRADVDLLGTKVGSVKEIVMGPGSGTTVVLSIQHGVKIPSDLTATIGSKSAIGEQYVELTPRSADGPALIPGAVIPLASTTSPLQVADLLAHLDGLAASIPQKDLATALTELSTAVDGLGPTMGRLIDASDKVTRVSLEHVTELTALIDDARTVLDTQVAKGPQTTAYLAQLASLTGQLRSLDGTFDEVFSQGIRAGTEVTNLLRDTQEALPVLLTNLLSLTDVAASRTQGLRKTLVIFPWVLEEAATVVRPCEEYNPRTGKPIQRTCTYDAQGRPVYITYLALQLAEKPGGRPYLACVKGYEGTTRYQPNGQPFDGSARQVRDSTPNPDARCTASPTDPQSPSVRGSQNAHDYGRSSGRAAPGWGLAMYDPNSGVVAAPEATYQLTGFTGPPPPSGPEGLGWLLTQPLTD